MANLETIDDPSDTDDVVTFDTRAQALAARAIVNRIHGLPRDGTPLPGGVHDGAQTGTSTHRPMTIVNGKIALVLDRLTQRLAADPDRMSELTTAQKTTIATILGRRIAAARNTINETE